MRAAEGIRANQTHMTRGEHFGSTFWSACFLEEAPRVSMDERREGGAGGAERAFARDDPSAHMSHTPTPPPRDEQPLKSSSLPFDSFWPSSVYDPALKTMDPASWM